MSWIDVETEFMRREVGAVPMLQALEAQDETLVLGGPRRTTPPNRRRGTLRL